MATEPRSDGAEKPLKVPDVIVKKPGLLLSIEKIQGIATREQLASDGGGTGRSDTNDNSLNTV